MAQCWKDSGFWILFSSSILLFSPLNRENFLWGFQIGFLLPLACVTACIWVATYVRHPFNFVFAIMLCTICTFSIASGLTSWLLATPLLMLGASAINIVQQMVGHLDVYVFARNVRVFLRLRKTGISCVGVAGA